MPEVTNSAFRYGRIDMYKVLGIILSYLRTRRLKCSCGRIYWFKKGSIYCPCGKAYILAHVKGKISKDRLAQKLFNEAGYPGNVYKAQPELLRRFENQAKEILCPDFIEAKGE